MYDLKHVVGVNGSPRWDGSLERPQWVFELMDRIISPGCLILSQFSCLQIKHVTDAHEIRLL